jgi:hypothetical protein
MLDIDLGAGNPSVNSDTPFGYIPVYMHTCIPGSSYVNLFQCITMCLRKYNLFPGQCDTSVLTIMATRFLPKLYETIFGV